MHVCIRVCPVSLRFRLPNTLTMLWPAQKHNRRHFVGEDLRPSDEETKFLPYCGVCTGKLQM